MADEVTPERVKNLLSSFLSGISKLNSHTKSESPQKAEVEKDRKKAIQIDGDKVSKEGKPDARDKDQFYNRVETYSPLTWFAKPLDLSPLMCARYGWENIDTDMLRCVSCRACLSGQLPKAVDTLVYKESYHKLQKNLIASHEKLCTWSSNPSPASFMLVPYHDKEELNKAIHKSLQSLIQAKSSLPTVTQTSFDEKFDNEDEFRTICENIQPQLESVVGNGLDRNTCLLAVTGWSYSSENINILHCNYCRRRIGLWNYSHAVETNGTDKNQNSKEMIQNGTETNLNGTENLHSDEECEQPKKKRVKIEKQNFDPIAEHRYWCPWLQTEAPKLYSKTTQIDIESRTSPNISPLKSSPSNNASLLLSTPSDKSVTDTETKKEAAWLIVLKLLSSKDSQHGTSHDFQAKMKWSPQLEGVRHVRHMLKECTSPREYTTSSSAGAKT